MILIGDGKYAIVVMRVIVGLFFFSSTRRHTRYWRDWSSEVCSSDLEQHGWLRLAGPRWRHLLEGVPGVSPDREYVPCTDAGSARLVGRINEHEYQAVADPPEEFRDRNSAAEGKRGDLGGRGIMSKKQ